MSTSLYKVSYTNIYPPPCHRYQQKFKTRAQQIPSTSITINSLSLTATKRPLLLVLRLQELGHSNLTGVLQYAIQHSAKF
jgi:hypothetical protein